MADSRTSPARRLHQVEDEFVGLWRQMSALWGISPTMAEIHGLLFITGKALSVDDIIRRLDISRGNVSMNVGKLIEWGLVKQVHKRGDRRDYYETQQDIWEMFTTVAAQRKRREIDPVLNTLRRCEEQLSPEHFGPDGNKSAAKQRRQRISDLLSIVTLIDSLAQRFFESQHGLRAAVHLLAGKEE